MAEVKTGLECVVGYINQDSTLGKVYYNEMTGSAGTKTLGVGTQATSGTNLVRIGSGVGLANGVFFSAGSQTATIGSAGAETVCKTIEMGTDGVAVVTAGGTAATVADAKTARAGTTAGRVPLAIVTVGTSGSVISGSIVDERTFATSTTLSYGLGQDYEFSDSPIHIYNGSAYAHSKKQRGMGKITLKNNMVYGSSPWPSTSSFATVPRIGITVDYKGITGTSEEVHLLTDCVKENESHSVPETEEATTELPAAYFGDITFR